MVVPTIRPVTRKLPDSKELWDDTNLPLCMVVTPAASSPTLVSSSRFLASLPKCLHCGAPHASKHTHVRPLQGGILLCYLCGKTSSTNFEDQQAGREQEVLDSTTFDSVPPNTDPEIIVNLPLFHGLYDRLPAKACPPVWWIVLDSTQTARSYWTTIGTILQTIAIPSHVHVGIIAAGDTHLSTWDLTCTVPHVRHTPYTHPQIPLALVPADALHTSNIQATLRAITDAQPDVIGTTNVDNNHLGMALGLALEVILEFMDEAEHPGQALDDDFDDDDDDNSKSPCANPAEALRYAGGKILCLLSNPPLEIFTKPLESQPPYGTGGVAGACSDPHKNKWKQPTVHPDMEPTDWTPTNLSDYVEPLDPEELLEELGTKCANAALGVDLLVLVPEEVEPEPDAYGIEILPFYGLPLLSVLADRSGAPGPLLFGTDHQDSVHALEQQILARTPWQPGMMFGAQLRSRISPGLDVEDSPVELVGTDKLQLAPFLSTAGLSGPAVMLEKALWMLGSCDPHTTVILDYHILGRPQTDVTAEGLGRVAINPVVQLCIAYTSVEQDEITGDYYTVRRLKIACTPLPVVNDTERLYDAMDPEVLATVLYHKLLFSAVQDGLLVAQDTAESWLKALLVCVYQSAQVEQARVEELLDQNGGNPLLIDDDELGPDAPQMVASDRLLDIGGGKLSEEEILLGQGHFKISIMPLIVYALMQCDALRPTMGSFTPSMDSRAAAMKQMASMTPTCLSKCIAPSLQLWSTKKDQILVESIDLSQAAIDQALQECKAPPDAVFFLDSPQQILVYRADHCQLRSLPLSHAPATTTTLTIGPNLQAAIDEASQAYRTPPPIRQELKPNSLPKAAAMAWHNILLEDRPLHRGIVNFEEWQGDMANDVLEELKVTGDIIS